MTGERVDADSDASLAALGERVDQVLRSVVPAEQPGADIATVRWEPLDDGRALPWFRLV
ncbi:MAG TPA: hypothetical protein VF942_15490 [Acidimicrobiales bacterium]